MSEKKKQVRDRFRKEVMRRDGYRCRICGRRVYGGTGGQIENEQFGINTILDLLDAHHIVSRNDFPNGGYVKENGISLCKIATPLPRDGKERPANIDDGRTCHEKAEEWLKTGHGVEGYDPDTLFRLVGSSLDLALRADQRQSP